jgi:hypothetical protein
VRITFTAGSYRHRKVILDRDSSVPSSTSRRASADMSGEKSIVSAPAQGSDPSAAVDAAAEAVLQGLMAFFTAD